ncbi:DNA N-6-adenine-methyltransferase [Sphingomonas sp.]|uniref:DNA N-6-adenine-methyltransferase n=1 Tax=Sphingomonas sp. TaxID=28214 RepID=UPI0035C7DB54
MRLARRSAGLSQQELADQLGLTVQVIHRLEAGIGSVSTLLMVMAALEFRLSGLGPGTTLAERLRRVREKRGLSLEELSRRTGLSRTTIAGLERGGGTVKSLQRLLAVLAPKVRRQAPERSYWGKGDKIDRDSRFTPPDFMASIYDAFGEIDIDPCSNELSPVVARRRILPSEGGDGLADDWSGRLAFVNPPYSELLKWLKRTHEQWKAGNVETVVCLVPIRTDSPWFQQVLSVDADLFLLQGRVRFLDPRGKGQHTPFSLMLVALGTSPEQRKRYAELVSGYWVKRS